MPDAWTFLYLGGDSYPACRHVEDALLEFHEDGVWVRDIGLRVAGLRRLLAGLGHAPDRTVAIGRSAGARVVTRLAAGKGGMNLLAATVCLAYPFRAPGGPSEPERFAHLAALRVPTLLLQGRGDAWGGPAEALRYPLPPALRLRALPCDHHTRLSPRDWDRVAGMIEAFLGRAPAAARAA